MSSLRKFRIFMAWQDEKEEDWLNEMSAKGFLLHKVVFPGFYHFETGEPASYTYRLDFKTYPQKDMDQYLQLFADAGWEHVGQFFNGWQYFRKAVIPGEEAEIYSDAESKIAKYHRLMLFLTPFVPLLFFSMITVSSQGMVFMQLLDGLLMVIYAITFVRLIQRVNELKKQL